MKPPVINWPPATKKDTEGNKNEVLDNCSIYGNRNPELRLESQKKFDEFITKVQTVDYWETIKDSRFDVYGGKEIEEYSNDVGLLGKERANKIKDFIENQDSIYQQGKFLRLLRSKLNELNFHIYLNKGKVEVFKMKDAEIYYKRRQQIFSEYEELLNSAIKDGKTSYVINQALITTKEWMHASEHRWNEDLFPPFTQLGGQELFLSGSKAFLVNKNVEKVKELREKYEKKDEIAKTIGNYLFEQLDPSIKESISKDSERVIVELEKIKNTDGVPLDSYLLERYPNAKEKSNFKQDYFDFLYFISKENYEFLKRDFHFEPQKLSIEEQFYFLLFLKKVNVQKADELKKFTSSFQTDGLRTFLSIEQEKEGEKIGDKILTLGEKLPKETADSVFKKYGEIIDNVNKIVEFAQHNFAKEIKTSPELIKKIEETLYIKGKQLLSQVYTDVSSEKEVNPVEIEKQLDRINADTITTFAIFKQAVKNGEELPIESIEGSVFSKKGAGEISKEQQEEMLNLYETNWKNHPDRDFVVSLKEYFKSAFVPIENQKRNHFYTFEKDMHVDGKNRHIRAFVRFEQQDDGSLYASALNVDEASKNFGLGEAMMDEALVREAKENILHASCRKDNPSNMRYFEKGFISNGFKNTSNTEELNLIWDEEKNKNILAKQKTVEELISMQLSGRYEGSIEIKKAGTLNELHKNIPQGKSLVRCFQNPLNKNEWYAVYEKIGDDYGVKEGETK